AQIRRRDATVARHVLRCRPAADLAWRLAGRGGRAVRHRDCRCGLPCHMAAQAARYRRSGSLPDVVPFQPRFRLDHLCRRSAGQSDERWCGSMTDRMADAAGKLLALAREAGADAADVLAVAGEAIDVELRDGVTEKLERSED